MDEKIKQSLRDKYDAATKKLTSASGPQSEKEFMVTYQALVRAGLADQIKHKYRGRR